MTSPTATVQPIERIVRELEARGIDTLVDAAHAPGMVPVDVETLNPAYWTADGHKWLCGPKSSGLLVVRADRRERIRPLVVSHGFNDLRPGRPRLLKEFDWQGTRDLSPYQVLPVALRTVAALHEDGWPGVMRANHDLVVEGRSTVAAALGIRPRIPESMLGSTAIVRLPIEPMPDAEIDALKALIVREHRIEVPIFGWPVPAAREAPDAVPDAVVVRISAQRYNELDDYERLGHVLAEIVPRAGIASRRPEV